jgi:hypothetical protein
MIILNLYEPPSTINVNFITCFLFTKYYLTVEFYLFLITPPLSKEYLKSTIFFKFKILINSSLPGMRITIY